MARLPHPPPPPTLTRAVREWSGWFVVAAGAVLSVLGWYGIAGESVIEQQLPYLASATIPGAAMIVAGAVLIATHRTNPADARLETLYSLLVTDTDEPTPAPPQPDSPTLLAIPGGTLYHCRDCPLVAGKPTAEPVDAATIAERELVPCPVCEPPEHFGGSAFDRPAPDHPGSDHATEPGQSGADQPPAAQPPAAQPAPASDQPSADRAAADQLASGQPPASPAAGQPAPGQPSTPRPTPDQPPDHPPAAPPTQPSP